MAEAPKFKDVEMCVADATSSAISALQELHDEMESWYGNLPESLQGSEKGERIQECVSALSEAHNMSLPDEVESVHRDDENGSTPAAGAIRFTYPASTKKRMSRADRCSEAVGMLRCVIDELRKAIADGSEEGYERYPQEARDEIETAINDIEGLCDQAEAAEFPGMYG